MAKVKIQGHASGTGVLTVTAPNTSTDRTITLPDGDVTLGAATPSIDDNGNATAITIDSSENVLIGKTTTALSTAGLTLGESGFASITRDGYEPLTVNRLSSNGDLAVFSKDGTAVGSIGAVGTEMYIGSPSGSDGFVRFQSLGLLPATSAGANSDATMSLGTSSARFTDLYLSGGLKVGGTGAANTLDDYEEGTYIPTLTGSTSGSFTTESYRYLAYTKIGRLVHIQGYLNINGESSCVGSITISLPFTPASGLEHDSENAAMTVSLRDHGGSGLDNITGTVAAAGLRMVSLNGSGTDNVIDSSDVDTTWNVRIGGCYIAT